MVEACLIRAVCRARIGYRSTIGYQPEEEVREMTEVVDPVELSGKKPRTTAPLKVDVAVDELITDGAHFLQMTKKDLVGAAVRMYLESRREEMRQAMLEKMAKLDGSAEADLALLTGISREKIRELGGTGEGF